MTTSVPSLPAYPSLASRKSLSPTQLSTLNQTVATALQVYISLPPEKRDTKPTQKFLSSYLKDEAFSTLQSLIWESSSSSSVKSTQEKVIRKRVLILAEKLAQSSQGLPLQTLVDLAIVYCSKNVSTVRRIFSSAFKASPRLIEELESDLLPAFVRTMSSAQSLGLYGIAKITYCISTFVRALTPDSEASRVFSGSKDLMVALATVYDGGLADIAHSYGGFPTEIEGRELDGWERIYMQAKVSIIDIFHLLLTSLLDDIVKASGADLGRKSEHIFSILSTMLDIPPSSVASQSSQAIPFLNRSLLTDYQHTYNLSKVLEKSLQRAAEDDARFDAIQSTLSSMDNPANAKDPGMLKILLRSSGLPLTQSKGKGKALATVALAPASTPTIDVSYDPEIDVKVTQVLDILPDHSPDYIRALLLHPDYPYRGNAEKVIEALLEGTAPSHEDLHASQTMQSQPQPQPKAIAAPRRNVFDEQPMDLSQVRFGKKNEVAVVQDKAAMEQMKADILRRAEELSKEEELEEVEANDLTGRVVAFEEDELDLDGKVKVGNDGEGSGDSEEEDDDEPATKKQSPETILELAYIRDPDLFARDAQTRRSKQRTDLKAQTGWGDEQIEGWKIMLEKNPHKDKILGKHEFSGNRSLPQASVGGDSSGPSRERGRGRGDGSRGGRGGGRGRGRGRGDGHSSGGGGDARDRARKERRGNQNRARGHDKKMRAMGPPS